MPNLRCRLGLHAWESTERPARTPGRTIVISTCEREACGKSSEGEIISVGWVRETICDSMYCHYNWEHAPHIASQLASIAKQRFYRAKASAQRSTPTSV